MKHTTNPHGTKYQDVCKNKVNKMFVYISTEYHKNVTGHITVFPYKHAKTKFYWQKKYLYGWTSFYLLVNAVLKKPTLALASFRLFSAWRITRTFLRLQFMVRIFWLKYANRNWQFVCPRLKIFNFHAYKKKLNSMQINSNNFTCFAVGLHKKHSCIKMPPPFLPPFSIIKDFSNKIWIWSEKKCRSCISDN